MFILNENVIYSHSEFCNLFDYVELTQKIDDFNIWIQDNGNKMPSIRSHIATIYTLLQMADDNLISVVFEKKSDKICDTIFIPKTDEKITKLFQSKSSLVSSIAFAVLNTALDNRLKKKAFCEALALYIARGTDFFSETSDTIEACYTVNVSNNTVEQKSVNTSKNKADSKKKVWEIYSGEIYTYDLYKSDEKIENNFVIETKKIMNCSPYGGDTAIVKVQKDGDTKWEFKLGQNDYIYVNTVNGNIVKVLRNIEYSSNTCVCRRDISKNELTKYIFHLNNQKINNQKIIPVKEVIDPILYKEASCFTVDYNGGIIMIENGKLNNHSFVPYEGIENPDNHKLSFAEVHVSGTKYLLLTNKGHTISNVDELDNLKGIVSIGFTNSSAYADKASGERMLYKINSKQEMKAFQNNQDIRESVIHNNMALAITNDKQLFGHGYIDDVKVDIEKMI